MRRTITTAIVSGAAMLALLIQPFLLPQDAGAVTAADWQAGNIIDDAIFTNTSAMTVSQIQSWLDTRLQNCDYYGTKPSELSGGIDYDKNGVVTRAEYGRTMGNPAPFTCLNDYYEVPKTAPSSTLPANNYGTSTIPSGAKSAAQLIYDAAQAYNISPKVLLVKLGTESAGPLTSDPWPFERQYLYAMGAHCPDSGPGGSANCDTDYAGFSLQIREAAKLLRWYLDSMTQSWWPYKKPYATNYILWNVEPTGCGGSNVFIKNKATAALYTYTPYQPNTAALNNLYGTGDGCSAYGNRNFWRVFHDWFTSTHNDPASFVTLSNPRYLEVAAATSKNDVTISYPVGGTITSGTLIKFASKTTYEGQDCLRTEYDTSRGVPYCILSSDLSELDLTATPLETRTVMTMKNSATKYTLRQNVPIGGLIEQYKQIEFAATINIFGNDFYVTSRDYDSGYEYAINSSDLLQGSDYLNLAEPERMATTRDTTIKNPTLLSAMGSVEKDSLLTLTSSTTTTDGSTYYRPTNIQLAGLDLGIIENDLLPMDFQPFSSPRWMRLKIATHKLDLSTKGDYGVSLYEDREVFFNSKISLGDKTYYRTAHDTNLDTVYAIDSAHVKSSLLNNFQPFSDPRYMTITRMTHKINLYTGSVYGGSLSAGMRVYFNAKVTLNGVTYYRTAHDTRYNNAYAIRASLLR